MAQAASQSLSSKSKTPGRPSPIKRAASQNMENLLGISLTFDSLYHLEKRLRSGSFATVYEARHMLTSKLFAVKVIDRRKLKPKDDQAVFREVEVMRLLSGCPGIVNLIDFFESPTTFQIVMDLAHGGDVFDRLASRTVYTEKDARDLAKKLLSTILYLHQHGVVHRDIKPENLLLMDDVNDTDVKLADFGFAKSMDSATNGLITRCGTPAFVAPEILLSVPYDTKADMWSIGCVIYLLICGYPPFQHENHRGLFQKIRAADFVFHENYWGEISIEAKQLIASLLIVDPSDRLTASQALKSDWILLNDNLLEKRDISMSLNKMRNFNGKRKLKGAFRAVTFAMTAQFWSSGNISLYSTNSTAVSKKNLKAKTREPTGFRDFYELKSKIRSGGNSTVWTGTHRTTGKDYAVKVIPRKNLLQKEDAAVLNEVAILQSLQNPHIVNLTDFFEEPEYFYVVMELMTGGDVFDRIVQKHSYTEKDARDLCRNLLKGVTYMHSHKIVHRDLKPQNLLLRNEANDIDILIADFGFAKRVHTPNSLITRCGTPTYVAPEVLKNIPHDEAADMWSVGVILYVLLVGYPPFMEDNQRLLFQKIRTGLFSFFEEDWKDISVEAKSLIRGLLVVDPKHRLSAQEALRDGWICTDDDLLSKRNLNGSHSELRRSYSELKTRTKTLSWTVNFGSNEAETIAKK